MDLASLVRDVPDFPEPGVIFKDITPVLAHPATFAELIMALAEPHQGAGISKVVGIEARGFTLAAPVAKELGAGFVPLRKPGKLPAETITETYSLEYGTDALEMHVDAVEQGEKVLIVDDVIATGGNGRRRGQSPPSGRRRRGRGERVHRIGISQRTFGVGRSAFLCTHQIRLTQKTTESGLTPIIDAHRRHFPDAGSELIEAAFETARVAHRGQIRKSGDPYITHPVAVTQILADYGLDARTLAAALLHDTVEDTDVTLHQVEAKFGPEVARLIDGVTKLDRIQYSSPQEAQAATIRKMVVAMAQDVRVLLIKLADRLHNIRTVSALRLEKQQRVARETLDVYVPLAHRLGVQEIKHELEDRCFAILEPGIYAEIEARLSERAPEREVFIEKVTSEIQAALSDAGIPATITGRPKHHFSIYRKMVESQRGFEDIFDLIGIRIITADTRGCYAALGLVHSKWVPISGRFKDFVAMPKVNLYQSLHTTVIGPDGKPLEVQIRTEEMHRLAESGIAAHWRYKEGPSAMDIPWVGDIRTLLETEDPQEFLTNLKLDFYQDEVFVLTPAGDVKTLPRGSTAIDFAYAVHTEVGNRCVGTRINGRLLPLSTRLESGDIVEVMTSKANDAGPSRDWLNFVTTSRAKAKIKAFFLRERREQALAEGREQLSTLIRKEGLGLSAVERDRHLADLASELGKADLDGLLAAVGDGSISARHGRTAAHQGGSTGRAGRRRRSPGTASSPPGKHTRGRNHRRRHGRHAGPDRPLLRSGPR